MLIISLEVAINDNSMEGIGEGLRGSVKSGRCEDTIGAKRETEYC